MSRKWLILVGAVVLFGLGGYLVKVFPDPDGGDEPVNLFTWLWRGLT